MAKTPETEHPNKAFGWAARDTSGILSPFSFSHREVGADDVTIKILYRGVCHSDLHATKNERGFTNKDSTKLLPQVPSSPKLSEDMLKLNG